MEAEGLECEDIDKLLLAAIRLADEHGEPALVMTTRPARLYGSGCRLAYCVLRSQASEWERANAYRAVGPERAARFAEGG